MNQIIWKQWHEDRRYFFGFLGWMLLALIYVFSYEATYRYRAIIGSFSGAAGLYGMFAAIIMAIRVSRGEQAAGTLSFTQSLPISIRRIAGVRIVGAILVIAIPILVSAALLSIALASGLVEQASPRPVDFSSTFLRLPNRETASLATAQGQLWSMVAIAILQSSQMLLVIAWLGCYLRSQSQVGFSGAVLMLSAMVMQGLFWMRGRWPIGQLIYGTIFPQSLAIHWGYQDRNGVGYTDHEIASYHWIAMLLSIPILLLIGWAFVRSFGRNQVVTTSRWKTRERSGAHSTNLKQRWTSKYSALAWLVLRQSVPLLIFGLMFAVLISVATAMIERKYANSEMAHTVWFLGMVWAALAGASLFASELQPGLSTFWRSRPIPVGLWFWCKFVVGLAAVLLILDGTTILTTWSTKASTRDGMTWAFVFCVPLIHACMFSFAIFGTCWSRNSFVGVVLAIVGFTLVMSVLGSIPSAARIDPVSVYNVLAESERAGQMDFASAQYPLVYGSMTLLTIVLAWLAFRMVGGSDEREWWPRSA